MLFYLSAGLVRDYPELSDELNGLSKRIAYYGDVTDDFLTSQGLRYDEPLDIGDRRNALIKLKAFDKKKNFGVNRYDRLPGKTAITEFAADVFAPILGRLGFSKKLFEKVGIDLVEYWNDKSYFAHRIRDRYSVALLDEYQDTDPAQRELLRTIFSDGFPVTAVGDSDQTVYEWRGASTRNFDDFPTHFPAADGSPATTLPLTENRRSAVTVLDAADAVRHATYGDEPYDRLQPVAGAAQGEVHAAFFCTAVDEAEFIAGEIARLHAEEERAWRDIAVVFRRNKDMALVRDALQAQGVPVEVGSLGGLLDLPDVADLHAWLRTIERPGDSIALARILLGPRYRLGLADIAPLTSWIKPNRAQLGDDPDSGWPLVEAIYQVDQIKGLSTTARSRLLDFRRLYRRFLEAAQGS